MSRPSSLADGTPRLFQRFHPSSVSATVENRTFHEQDRRGVQHLPSRTAGVSNKRVVKTACRRLRRAPFLVQFTGMTSSPTSLSAALTPDDVLAPEPATVTGVLIGYARVSTTAQLLDRQLRALNGAGCAKVFSDQLSGRDADRPQLQACLAYLRAGDTLVVPSLDRLSRSLQDLITLLAELRRRGIGFRSLHEALDTTTPGGRLVFHVFAALAEFIRELIVEGTRDGLAAARARGVRLGRPPAMTPEQVHHARDLLTHPDNTVSSIARLLNVSRSTIYKYVPELSSHNTAGGTPELDAVLTALPEDRRPLPDVTKYDDLLPAHRQPPTAGALTS